MSIDPEFLQSESVLQYQITLVDVAPRIWRRIVVPAVFTFRALHFAIQDAMGWQLKNNYQFYGYSRYPGRTRTIDHPTGPKPMVHVGADAFDYFERVGDTAMYLYDFHDRWEHKVQLETAYPKDKFEVYPVCIGGERACPPEGIGGPRYYNGHLRVLADPNHPDHARCLAYIAAVGASNDPDRFDCQSVVFSSA